MLIKCTRVVTCNRNFITCVFYGVTLLPIIHNNLHNHYYVYCYTYNMLYTSFFVGLLCLYNSYVPGKVVLHRHGKTLVNDTGTCILSLQYVHTAMRVVSAPTCVTNL